MLHWKAGLLALTLIVAGALYIRHRWGRSPQAYRAMIALAICYFAAGTLASVWLMQTSRVSGEPQVTALTQPVALPSANPEAPEVLAPSLNPDSDSTALTTTPSGAPFASVYDPTRAVRPDPRLTPGDASADAKADDVCTPGWAREHRNVSESDRERVYAEYTDSTRTCLCVEAVRVGAARWIT